MQDATIFRQAAIDHHRRGKFSSIAIPHFNNYTWFFLVTLVLMFVMGAWLIERNYVRYQTIKGYVQPDKGLLIHRAQKAGRVNEINVVMGERVREGQVLMTIAALNFDISGIEVFQEQRDSLHAQMVDLSHSDDRLMQLNELRAESYASELLAIKQQIVYLESAQTEQANLINLAEKRLQKTQQLKFAGHVSETVLDDVTSQLKRLTLQQSDIARELTAENAKLLRVESDVKQLPIELAQLLAANDEKRKLLTQKLTLLNSEGGQVIVAAADGIVDEIPFHVGEEVAIGTSLVNLLPANSLLEGELKIPTFASGFVEPGQTLYLRYDAYPYQKYGTYKGRILNVAKTPISDGHGNYYYNAKVSLDGDSIHAHGKDYALKTGMSFEADVVLSRRSFMEWLLEPLFSLKGA